MLHIVGHQGKAILTGILNEICLHESRNHNYVEKLLERWMQLGALRCLRAVLEYRWHHPIAAV